MRESIRKKVPKPCCTAVCRRQTTQGGRKPASVSRMDRTRQLYVLTTPTTSTTLQLSTLADLSVSLQVKQHIYDSWRLQHVESTHNEWLRRSTEHSTDASLADTLPLSPPKLWPWIVTRVPPSTGPLSGENCASNIWTIISYIYNNAYYQQPVSINFLLIYPQRIRTSYAILQIKYINKTLYKYQ